MDDSTRQLKVLYAAGPGDVIGTYRHWRDGCDDPSQVHVTYSGQFFDQCRRLGAQALVIASCARRDRLDDGAFSIRHRPVPFRGAGGVLYHIGQIWYGVRLLVSAARFRPQVAVISEGTTHWFMISLLRLLGTHIVPSIHCVLWPKFGEAKGVKRFMLRRGRRLFSRHASAILTASEDIARQVGELAGAPTRPIVQFLPVFRRGFFEDIPEPDVAARPFRVLYAGRVEACKGVFDLAAIAQQFHDNGRRDIEFDVCGTGAALDDLRRAADDAPFAERFRVHGHCHHDQMRDLYGRCHIVIVPTRTDFVEGFNQVVVEAVLAGRPVITSAVCPALSYVEGAAIEVEPDDVDGYRAAIERLCDDRTLYDEKQVSSVKIREQFYDESRGWGEALRSVLLALQQGREPVAVQLRPVTDAAA